MGPIIMLPEVAHFALILAFLITFVQLIIPAIGLWKNNNACMRVALSGAGTQFFLVAFSFFALQFLFYKNDFSVTYIALNSNTHMPLLYKLGAVWGAHAGSLLLWIFVLTLWSAAVAFFYRYLPIKILTCVLMVMSMITLLFESFLLTHADPFARVFPPLLQGVNLNPILQDPGLLFHPPLLYLGYVGFSVVFAFAITALLIGKNDFPYAKWMRPWAQLSWCFLTLGIVMGSWWSYRELGWGGFWFWDPVENASFMPWLVGTALLHALLIGERNNSFSAWAILLSLCVFSLSILGTFLVRSGILVSVHTFSEDPSRGLFLLRVFFVVVGTSLFLYALRARRFLTQNPACFFSAESMILINNILLLVAMLTVLLGTLYPIMMSVMHFQTISVGAPYFNTVLLPILIPVLFFMIFSTIWFGKLSLQKLGMLLAHSGFFIAIVAVFLTTFLSQERQLAMTIGDTEQVGQYYFTLKNVTDIRGENFSGVQAALVIKKNKVIVARVFPELRRFTHPDILLPKAGIHVGILGDFYVALGNPLRGNAWTVQIDVKPMVRWIWGGGILMVIGGLCALINRKYRV